MKLIAIIISYMISFIIIISSSNISSLIITNGPQDTTVCMNVMAECYCGFTGTDPSFVRPNWRIVYRSDDGSIVNNDTVDGDDIFSGHINGLQWVPDITSGDNNSTNSKLLVGPVNMTHNQSSYQCIFTFASLNGLTSVISSVGTMTIVDSPSIIITVNKTCTTSITISLITHNHPSCGEVSHNVTISGNVVYNVDGSRYTIDGLQSDTLYNIKVTSTYNSGSRIFNKPVRTSLSNSPFPIDVTSIETEEVDDNNVVIMWKQPEIDSCSMLAIKHYDVKIYSNEGEIVASGITEITSITLSIEHNVNDYSNTTFTVNVTVTVVDTEGHRSTTTSATEMINATQIMNSTTVDESLDMSNKESDGNSDDGNAIVIPIAVVAVMSTVLITIIIIIIIYVRHRHLHKSHDVKSGKKTEDNSYVETQDNCKSDDLASPYAVSGPTSAWSDSAQSNKNEIEAVLEPSIDNDLIAEPLHNDNSDEDKSAFPLPPKLNYAEIQLTNQVPKFMKADDRVFYAETKPA